MPDIRKTRSTYNMDKRMRPSYRDEMVKKNGAVVSAECVERQSGRKVQGNQLTLGFAVILAHLQDGITKSTYTSLSGKHTESCHSIVLCSKWHLPILIGHWKVLDKRK